jgi:transglutaminase-like putative cysteine protease
MLHLIGIGGQWYMVRMAFSTQLEYEIRDAGCDFIFNLQAAYTPRQTVVQERLRFNQGLSANIYTDAPTQSRFIAVHALQGQLSVQYSAGVDLTHFKAAPNKLSEISPQSLPGHVLPYLYPSRYCQSDRLLAFASQQFGSLMMGYSRAQAIRDWVYNHVRFQGNTSNSNTSALDTLIDRVGVCRDFAHLMIAMCRAVNLPARMVSSMDYGADPALGPSDFHAYVEVYLADASGVGRWYMFDPSGTAIPMGFVRFGTGRDAADIAFATIFGHVMAAQPVISIQVVPDADGRLVVPRRVPFALSTDGP